MLGGGWDALLGTLEGRCREKKLLGLGGWRLWGLDDTSWRRGEKGRFCRGAAIKLLGKNDFGCWKRGHVLSHDRGGRSKSGLRKHSMKTEPHCHRRTVSWSGSPFTTGARRKIWEGGKGGGGGGGGVGGGGGGV